MIEPVLTFDVPVTLIGGGVVSEDDMQLALRHAPRLIAADGGANTALSMGQMPEAVIGDLDSLDDGARAQLTPVRLHKISEQDSTDFDKALRCIKAPLVIGIGFLGARLDHQLAVLNALARRNDCFCVLIGEHEIVFHASTRVDLALQPSDTVSLFPLAHVRAKSSGLQWPLDGLQLSPDGQIGTSNRALGAISIDPDGPGLITMVPRRRLSAVLRGLGARYAETR